MLDQHIHRLLNAAIDFHTNDTSQFKIIPSFDQIKNFVEEKVPQDTNTFKRVIVIHFKCIIKKGKLTKKKSCCYFRFDYFITIVTKD